MNNPHLIKNYLLESATGQYRVVAFGSADNAVVQASLVSQALMGVCIQPGGGAIGDSIDVVLDGATEIEFGGTVARGDLLTTDSVGRAVTAAPASGIVNNIIGRACESGVLGTIGSVLLIQAQIKG